MLEPPTPASQSVGDAWVESGTHPVLSVPSAIVPEERNYLLNPAHPEFSRIVIARPATYRIDPAPAVNKQSQKSREGERAIAPLCV